MNGIKELTIRLLPIVLLAALPLRAQTKPDGLWDAVVVVGPAEIPFQFEISGQGAELKGFFFEGQKRIGSTSAKYADGKLQFDYEFLNTTLTASLIDERLEGSYR